MCKLKINHKPYRMEQLNPVISRTENACTWELNRDPSSYSLRYLHGFRNVFAVFVNTGNPLYTMWMLSRSKLCSRRWEIWRNLVAGSIYLTVLLKISIHFLRFNFFYTLTNWQKQCCLKWFLGFAKQILLTFFCLVYFQLKRILLFYYH